jgi:hypothetical protein
VLAGACAGKAMGPTGGYRSKRDRGTIQKACLRPRYSLPLLRGSARAHHAQSLAGADDVLEQSDAVRGADPVERVIAAWRLRLNVCVECRHRNRGHIKPPTEGCSGTRSLLIQEGSTRA